MQIENKLQSWCNYNEKMNSNQKIIIKIHISLLWLNAFFEIELIKEPINIFSIMCLLGSPILKGNWIHFLMIKTQSNESMNILFFFFSRKMKKKSATYPI